MSYSQYMDIANSVMWEAIHATNYNSHNTSREFKPVAFHYSDLSDKTPEAYIYPYTDTFNPFVMIEGSTKSFTSFVYGLINPETYDPSMLLTISSGGEPNTITNYEATQKFLTTHPAARLSSESSYGIVIDEQA